MRDECGKESCRRAHILVVVLAITMFLAGCTGSNLKTPVSIRDGNALLSSGESGNPSATGAADLEVEWETYENKQFGYEIEYPKDWGIIEAKPRSGTRAAHGNEILYGKELHKITFLEKGYRYWPGEFQVIVLANPDSLGLEDWVQALRIEDVSGGDLIQGKMPAVMGGKAAIRLSIFGFDHEEINVVGASDERYIYNLCFTGATPNDPELKRHRLIYDAMAASFAFIE